MTSRWAGLAVCLLAGGCGGVSQHDGMRSVRIVFGTAKPTGSPTPAPNACVPASSLSLLVQGKNVTAYLPQGSWDWRNDGSQSRTD